MSPPAPAVCVLILLCVLCTGHAGIIGPSPPVLKTSDLSATKDICSDCTSIMELLSDMLSQADAESLIQKTLDKICNQIPSGKVQKECLGFVEKYLPLILQKVAEFTAQKEKEICKMLGLCPGQPEQNVPELLNAGLQEVGFVQVQPWTGNDVHELQVSPQCTFCLFLIKKLEDMLPKERTEETVVKVLEQICDHLPAHYKEQCDDMVEKYGKEIIDFLLTTATPHTICMLLHLCLVQDTPAMVPTLPSDCNTCKTLMILTQTHLGQNSTETQMMSLLWKTCHRHPNALPGCEPFIQSHVTALVNILSKQQEAVNACQTFFCVGRE